MEDDTDTEVSSQDSKIFDWRFEELTRLGFGSGDATLLANGHADLSTIRKLIEHGCSPDLATRIML